MKYAKFSLVALAAWLALPAVALASIPQPSPVQGGATTQVWVFVVGALSPLVSYVINHFAPWVSSAVKSVVFVFVAAVAAALTQAINAGDVGFNDATFQLVVTGVLGALAAHWGFWTKNTVADKFGNDSDHVKGGKWPL